MTLAGITLAGIFLVSALAAIIVILGLCKAANDRMNPRPDDEEYPDLDD